MTRVAVVGLGLIGGSAAMALEAHGYDRAPEARASARRMGIRVAETLAEAVEGAEIVVTGVSTAQTPALLREISALAPGVLLTDTASLKSPMVLAAQTLRAGARFVGGHPMAGSRDEGIGAATPELFRGRPWALVATARSEPASIAVVSDLVKRAGARPVLLDGERHDRLMTWISHLPHAVAVSLTRAASAGAGADLPELAGPGFLETTRIAGRRLELALELALAQPEALASAIDAVAKELHGLASTLRGGDAEALSRFFSEASAVRRGLEEDRPPA